MTKKISRRESPAPRKSTISDSHSGATPFDLEKHVYKNDAFVELVKDAVRFFNGTPVHRLSPPEKFHGTGIYALYYTGQTAPFAKYAELNRLAYDFPIYVGKAVPQGWRQSRADRSLDLFRFLFNIFTCLTSLDRPHCPLVGLDRKFSR